MERHEHDLHVGDRKFTFQLYRKPDEMFGTTPTDHWWMKVTPLYGQRQNRHSADRNRLRIIEFYWEYCLHTGNNDVPEVRERVVLASLLPKMRSQGSRQIFNDAFLRAAIGERSVQEVNDLNAQILQQRGNRVPMDEFHDQTACLLSTMTPDGELRPKYLEMSETLFREPLRSLDARNGLEALIANASETWSSWQKKYGRRGRHEDEKMVMNILSYEAKAAFHQLYSLVWLKLIESLTASHGISPATAKFLKYWHTDLNDPDRRELRSEGCWSLFHGHVFALHPASGRFGLTIAGRSLLGEFLQANEAEETAAFERVLNGILIAVGEYSSRHADQSLNRNSREFSGQDIERQSDRSSIRHYQNERRDVDNLDTPE